MSKLTITDSLLTGIANAIRGKNGSSDLYTPAQMATAIQAIPTGITPTGTVNITQNGTTDVTQYASANVNVQPNLQSKTATQNGTVTPDSGYDGLSSVVVNVSGGGSTYAFAKVTWLAGVAATATDGTTTLSLGTSGSAVAALPNAGTWTFTDGTTTKTLTPEYGGSYNVALFNECLRFWTKSTGGNDAAMYIQYGYYNPSTSTFTAAEDAQSLKYTEGSTAVEYHGIASLRYPGSYWYVYALQSVTDGTNTYSSGDTVKQWTYNTSVDFYVWVP